MDALVTLFGRLHPLTVHFPIALWLVVGAALLSPRWRRSEALRPLVGLALASTVLAVATGLVFAAGQRFQGDAATLIERHRNLGLLAGAVGLVGVAIMLIRPAARALWGGAIVLTAGLAAAGAHLGGLSVFGEDFYSLSAAAPVPAPAPDAAVAAPPAPDAAMAAPAPDAAPPPPPPAPTVDFTAEVWPILKKSCVRCHGPKKQKGELRLDSRAAAMAGGEDGPVIVAGRPEESDLYRRVSLPHDDEDYMPSKGDPLTDEQVEVLRRWIAAGAAWPE